MRKSLRDRQAEFVPFEDTCSTCQQRFWRTRYNNKTCRGCIAAYDKQRHPIYYAENREAVLSKSKEYHYRSCYGISLEQRQEMLARGCALCGSVESLHIDHCHESGEIRGVLCRKHNMMLGLANDSPEILRKAADYLES